MKERKYKEDYSLRSFINEKGKEKREAVYQGDYFRFENGEKERKKLLIWAAGSALIFFLLYFAYMKMNTPGGRCMYVMPIAACALIPFVYWCRGLYALLRAPERMIRLQKENSTGRILRSCIGCALLLFMACLGDILFMIISLKNRAGEEVPGFALLCCAAVIALGTFLRIRESERRLQVIHQ